LTEALTGSLWPAVPLEATAADIDAANGVRLGSAALVVAPEAILTRGLLTAIA
jgi:hypothetical protein